MAPTASTMMRSLTQGAGSRERARQMLMGPEHMISPCLEDGGAIRGRCSRS